MSQFPFFGHTFTLQDGVQVFALNSFSNCQVHESTSMTHGGSIIDLRGRMDLAIAGSECLKPALFSVATETTADGNRSTCQYPKWKEKEPQNGPCKPFVQFNYPLKRRKEKYYLLVRNISKTTTVLTSPEPETVTPMMTSTISDRNEMTRTREGKLSLFCKKSTSCMSSIPQILLQR